MSSLLNSGFINHDPIMANPNLKDDWVILFKWVQYVQDWAFFLLLLLLLFSLNFILLWSSKIQSSGLISLWHSELYNMENFAMQDFSFSLILQAHAGSENNFILKNIFLT